VPFLFGPSGENLFDSSAIARWLDRDLEPATRVVPDEPRVRFIVNLIDDYADEVGLYMVHHNRWKVAAADNNAGERVAREFRFLSGPAEPLFARWFTARQVRRLPYLFSVAPKGFHIEGLQGHQQPPDRDGFPPTHDMLEDAFDRLLGTMEDLLARRPFVLGDRLTLADAALYGQLSMNLIDPSANVLIRKRAPRTHAWLERLHAGDPSLLEKRGKLAVDEAIRPLLAEIFRVHVPLMQQNVAAYNRFKASIDDGQAWSIVATAHTAVVASSFLLAVGVTAAVAGTPTPLAVTTATISWPAWLLDTSTTGYFLKYSVVVAALIGTAVAVLRSRMKPTSFSEALFNSGRALYDGSIDGRPFRSVAKSFQAKVWRERVAEWRALSAEDRAALADLLPHGAASCFA
jgi:glutathione S-transferase